MTGKTHQIIGLSAGLAYFLATSPAVYNPATFGMVLAVSSIGALLPDIDSPAAKIWSYLPFGNLVGETINPLLQHRNITHSILGVMLIGLLSHRLLGLAPVYWGWQVGTIQLSFLIAYASHILADMVTVQGVPLLFPYQRMFGIPPRPFQGLRIETGQWFENLIVFPLVNVGLITLVWQSWPQIQRVIFK